MEFVAVKMGRINLLDLLDDSVVYRKNSAKSRTGPMMPPPPAGPVAARAANRCKISYEFVDNLVIIYGVPGGPTGRHPT